MKRFILISGIAIALGVLIALVHRVPLAGDGGRPTASATVADELRADVADVAPAAAARETPAASAREAPAAPAPESTGPRPSAGAPALVESARALLSEGHRDEAEASALAATQADPRHAAAWQILGRTQLARSALAEAASSFEYACSLDSTNAHAFNNLGFTWLQRGDWQRARRALERAIALQDDVAYFHNNLGVACERLADLECAARAYGRALELDADHAKARVSLARVLPHLGSEPEQVATSGTDSSVVESRAPAPR